MKKYVFLALVAMIFAACDQMSPEQQQLIGTWHEPYGNVTVKSLTFNADGTLIYNDKPDTTSNPIIDWAGDYASLQYAVEKGDLSICGKREVFDETTQKAAYENFKYTTSYTSEGNMLVIDSFAYDGGVNSMFRPLKLEKQ